MPTAAPTPRRNSMGVDGKVRPAGSARPSNTGQLYGSVSARDIAEALEGAGAHVAKRARSLLDRPIKAIGKNARGQDRASSRSVQVTVKVNVARSPEEADLQAQGVDVMAQMFERDSAAFTEAYDPNAEPGATAESPAEEASDAASKAPADEFSETPAEAGEETQG